MKRTRNYEVNYLNKTVTVTRKFMDAATQMNSDEFTLLTQFSELGLRVLVENRKRRKKEDGKPALLTYQMMIDYMAMLDDAEVMLEEFGTLRAASRNRPDRTKHINKWFREKFPRYDEVPEFDDDYRIVHNPNPVN